VNYIKKKNQLILALALAVFCMGCSSGGPMFKPITYLPADQSVIYLYRLNDDENKEFTITYNEKEICVLENDGYFPFYVNEGKVKISAAVNFNFFTSGLVDLAALNTNFVFEAEIGKSYYIKCNSVGALGQELSIRLVPENFGINNIKECRLLEPISQ